MWMGLAEKDPALFKAYAGSVIWLPPETRMAEAAASPRPLSVKTDGATPAIFTLAAVWVEPPAVIFTWARPGATVDGKVTCQGETNRRGAAAVLPAESTMDTEVPSKLVGEGPRISPGMPVASPCPRAKASEPGAIDVVLRVAADVINGTPGMGVLPAAGANATPRKTSPATAVRRVVNCSLAATAGSVLERTSVMDTSLFGSAPWSPLALMVEVTAQMVTVPSLFTLPVRLRRPSVAGFSEVG